MSTVVLNGIQALGRVSALSTASRSTVPARAHLRITARGRAVLTALVATPLVIAALVLSLNAGGAAATGSGGAPLQSVTVLAGQSLWALAGQVAPQADPREFIADVLSLNGLTSAEVRPGQQLQIPAAYSD